MKRRILSLILTVIMVLSLITSVPPLSAKAANGTLTLTGERNYKTLTQTLTSSSSDVFGDGCASYDSATNTLTYDSGVETRDGRCTEITSISYSGSDKLSIKLVNSFSKKVTIQTGGALEVSPASSTTSLSRLFDLNTDIIAGGDVTLSNDYGIIMPHSSGDNEMLTIGSQTQKAGNVSISGKNSDQILNYTVIYSSGDINIQNPIGPINNTYLKLYAGRNLTIKGNSSRYCLLVLNSTAAKNSVLKANGDIYLENESGAVSETVERSMTLESCTEGSPCGNVTIIGNSSSALAISSKLTINATGNVKIENKAGRAKDYVLTVNGANNVIVSGNTTKNTEGTIIHGEFNNITKGVLIVNYGEGTATNSYGTLTYASVGNGGSAMGYGSALPRGTAIPSGKEVSSVGTFKKIEIGNPDSTSTAPQSYAITCASSAYGTITADKTSSTANQYIQVTVTPVSSDYESSDVWVTTKSGTATKATPLGDNKYQFKMPASDVTVSADFATKKYAVNLVYPSNMGDFSSSTSPAEPGTEVTVTATAKSGYECTGVSVNKASGASLGSSTGTTVTFTMPSENVTATATFEAKTYSITKGSATNGTFTVPASAKYGSTVTVSDIVPNTGYEVKSVTVTPSATVRKQSDGTYTFAMPAGNATVTVNFSEKTYAINTADSSIGGSFTVNKTSAKFNETVTVNATPIDGYQVKEITYTGSGTPVKVSGNSFKMPAEPVTVSVTFEKKTYTINCGNPANGTVSYTGTPKMNESIQLVITPDAGYVTDTITIKNKTNSQNIEPSAANSFTMPASNVDVTVTFKKQAYSITCDNNIEGGNVTASADNAYMGTNITVSATADTGYRLDGITVTNDATGAKILNAKPSGTGFTMPAANVTVTASFSKLTYNITKKTTTNGSFSWSGTANYGSTITVNPSPNEGYELDRITVYNSTAKENVELSGKTFLMPAGNVEITVTFKKVSYDVKIAATANGTVATKVSGSVATKAQIGDSVSVVLDPATGYELDTLTVKKDGATTSIQTNKVSNTVYTFDMPAGAVTVTATFKKKNYSVSIDTYSVTGGAATVSASQAQMGDTVTITPNPETGYMVDTITVTSDNYETVNVASDNSFTMPAGNVSVRVTYKKRSYQVSSAATSNGSFTVDKSAASYGDTVTITTSPANGYEQKQIKVEKADGTEVTVTSGKFTMPDANVTVSVLFAPKSYNITKGSSTGGSFKIDTTAPYNSYVTVSDIVPDKGYVLDKITYIEKGSGTSNQVEGKSFKMPANDVTVTVVFKTVTYNVTKEIDQTKGDFVRLQDSYSYNAHASFKVNVTDSNYKVGSVQIKDAEDNFVNVTSNSDGEYFFDVPPNDVTVSVTFVVKAHVHGNPTKVEATASTCTKAGNKEYYVCGCGTWFRDEDCNTEITDHKSVNEPLADHNATTVSGKAPTCTEAGLTEGKKCSVCDKILVEQVEIPAKGHTEEIVLGKAATCTESGLTNGTKCSVCEVTLTERAVIPAKGHKEVTDAAVPATTTKTGLTEGTHCSECGEVLVAQQVIPLLAIEAESISLDKTTISDLEAGQGSQLIATILPENTSNKTVSWSSTNTTVARVDASGYVTALNAGTATIKATTANGKTASCTVTVKASAVVVTDVTLNKTSLTMRVGGTETLVAEVLPVNADDKTLKWSSNNACVTVKNGSLTAVSAGKATVTVTSANGVTATCEVTVEVPVSGIELDKETMNLNIGESGELKATVKPSGAKNKKVTWSSNNTGVATVDANGNVTAAGAGTAVITARTEDGGFTARCTVTVNAPLVEVTGVTVDKTATVEVGKTTTLTATVLPTNATDKSLTWTSSNMSIATVDANGTVTGVKKGVAIITVKTANGYSAQCGVTVKETETNIDVTGVSISPNTVNLDVGGTRQLAAGVTPANAADKSITWSSSDMEVATVDAYGNVTAKAAGTAVITARSGNGKTASCTVTVNTPNVNVFYHTHIQTYGDKKGVSMNGVMSGTSGESKRLENIWIKVDGNPNLGIQYTTHCQTYGWLPWSCDGEANGTSGEAKRLEAIKIQLTGRDADKYDVYYRVHAQTYGWLGWAKNGEPSGTAGYAKRLEGIQVVVVKKGEAAPDMNFAGVNANAGKHTASPYVAKTTGTITIPGSSTEPNIMYKTHVQSFGWQTWKTNGQMSGTSGKSKRLEGINIKLSNCPYEGGVRYKTHVQKYGWQGWRNDGAMSGTSGEAKRLEAIQIELTGEMAKHYDVYYRVHAQSYGWLGWAKNGEESGTAGYAKRLEGIQIVLVPKGYAAPANNYGGITSVRKEAYIKK